MVTRLHARNGIVGEGVKFERIRRVTGYLVKLLLNLGSSAVS